MKAKPNHQERQRGSALILVLGILSLVLVMGMAFAFTARTNRQVAKVNADAIKTRLQSESALNWVLALLQNQGYSHPYIGRNFTSLPLNNIGGYNYALGFTLSNGAGYSEEAHAYDADSRDKIAYDLLAGTSGYISNLISTLGLSRPSSHSGDPLRFRTMTDSASGTVIGRYAFIVLEDTSKLDLNEILTYRNNDANNLPFVRDGSARLAEFNDSANLGSSDFYYNVLGDFTPATHLNYGTFGDTTTVPDTLRLGNSLREIRLPGRTFFDPLTANLGQRNECLRPWMSYQHLNDAVSDYASTYSPLYTFYSGEEPESYYVQNGSSFIECARFDLTGYEWCHSQSNYYTTVGSTVLPTGRGSWDPEVASPTDDQRRAYARALHGYLMGDAQRHNFWSDDGGNARPSLATRKAEDVADPAKPGETGFGIPWLNAQAKPQLTANLIDYCDADHLPTASKDFTFDDLCDLNGPEYFGKEQVPYLNELMVETRLEYPRTSALGVTPEQYQIRFSIIPQVELVNIFPQGLFDGSGTYTCRLRLYGNAFRMPTPGGAETPLDTFKGGTESGNVHLDFNGTVSIPSTAASPASVGFSSLTFTAQQLYMENVTYTGTGAEPISSMQFKVEVERAVLDLEDSNGNIVDIAVWSNNSSPAVISHQEDEEMMPDDNPLLKSRYSTLQTKDPRANYQYKDDDVYTNLWEWRDGSQEKSNTASDGFWTAGAVNSNFWLTSRSDDQDFEDDVTFASNTNSYSTAFIRNAPMESLWELGVIPTGEIGKTINLTKESADALLDQVKIGPVKFARGKYNANTRNPGAVEHLLEGVFSNLPLMHTGKELYIHTSGDDGELQYNANKPDGTPWSLTSLPAATDLQSRGAAARQMLADIVDNEASLNEDLLKEQYIGRTVNLMSTRYEMFTIIIIAQSLRELQNLPAANFENYRSTLSNPTLYNDGLGHSNSQHVCEILGSQVMQVQVLRDAWRNEFRVLQRQIIEE